MATLREYYEKDFAHQFRLAITTTINGDFIDGAILCDLDGLYTFVAFYVADTRQPLDYFMRLLSHLKHDRLTLNGNLTFSAAKQLQKVYIENNLPDELKLGASYFGDTDVMWISTKNMPSSRRVFIYSDQFTTKGYHNIEGKSQRNGL